MTVHRDDVVFVPVVGPIVGVAGNVRRPAIYELKDATDLHHSLPWRGIIPSAWLHQIQVSRVQNNDRQVVIDLNDRELGKSKGSICRRGIW
jgi:protein involved in polysaccharide export with SLBB domain